MKPVIQQDRTGCGLASAAAIAGKDYSDMKNRAAAMGITPDNIELWSHPDPIRQLLASVGYKVADETNEFTTWESLPDLALLAIKWRLLPHGPAWHWVVFHREANGAYDVLDSKKTLKHHRRRDFGRMKPKWYLPVTQR